MPRIIVRILVRGRRAAGWPPHGKAASREDTATRGALPEKGDDAGGRGRIAGFFSAAISIIIIIIIRVIVPYGRVWNLFLCASQYIRDREIAQQEIEA